MLFDVVGQVVRHSPVNRDTRPNFSESFYITRDRAPDHPDIVNSKPMVGLNRWPPDMPEFRAPTTAYYAAMEAMTLARPLRCRLCPGRSR
jgi:isopenicillin N synthase-like dioxygenase